MCHISSNNLFLLGHEMFFAMVLYCLFKIEAFKKEDADQVILKVFDR